MPNIQNKPLQNCQRGNFCQSDQISPNLVTLAVSNRQNNLTIFGRQGPTKRRHSRNFSEATAGGYNDHSLLPYTSSPFASAVDPVSEEADEDDLRMQLIQKENDLILAAELGKALLVKNEELKEANEKMADEFSERLEVR